MSKGGGDPQRPVTDYYMSIHFGVCHAGVDAITGIYCGEKTVWEGEFTGAGAIGIDKRRLFGGNKKEGGCAGSVVVLPGDPDQVLPDPLAKKMGAIDKFGRNVCPGYRGIFSLFFTSRANWDGAYPDEDV